MHTTCLQPPAAPHATVVSGPGVWMESDAVDQLHRTAALPGCVAAVGMPDLHPGPSGPIGAAFAFSDRLYPALLGSDAGCGALLVATTLEPMKLDSLERRVRNAFESDSFDWAASVIEPLARKGIAGLAEAPDVPESLRELAALEPPEPDLTATMNSHAALFSPLIGHALGTIGGGNHFAEVVRVGEIPVRETASTWGVRHGRCAVLVHSGARSLGKLLADRFNSQVLAAEDSDSFLSAHDWACRFARANRFVIAWRLLVALGAARPDKVALAADCVHNQIERYRGHGQEVWLHRKGAAPARAGAPTVLLGSRGASSWLMVGAGNESSLESMAHGAGRRMTRAEAASKLGRKHSRESLRRTRMGGRVLCDDTRLLYEEHPEAYKSAEAVSSAVTAAGMASPVAALDPILTVKL